MSFSKTEKPIQYHRCLCHLWARWDQLSLQGNEITLAYRMLGFVACWISSTQASFGQSDSNYPPTVQAFFANYCLHCHGPDQPQGEFRLDREALTDRFEDLTQVGRWKEIVNVLNSHQMPPDGESQPSAAEVAATVDWISSRLAQAELDRKDGAVVLRRMNRSEYRNTIRDLIGIDFDSSIFPQDTPAGGFDNNGRALSFSPLLMELYLNAAQQILDRALVADASFHQPAPEKIHFRFHPRVVAMDTERVRVGDFRAIVNGGNNQTEGDFVSVRNHGWDKTVNARDFRVPLEGTYAIRVRAAGRVPDRTQVVQSAQKLLQARFDREMQDNPKGERWHREALANDLKHFESDRMYDYGPPRMKIVLQLGSQPRTIAELDVDASLEEPQVYEFQTRFTTESVGITLEYAYEIPKVLENFWMQNNDQFARPELLIDWFEIEGPLYDAWPPSSHSKILFDSPLKDSAPVAYASRVLNRFMHRAYRRPVAREEVESKLALFELAWDEKKDFVEAIKVPLASILTSSHFLFLAEATIDPRPKLNDFELASRLSYFLWSSMPDSELFELAKGGRLSEPAVRMAQVDRMLADPKSEDFVRNFAGQWLNLRDVGTNPPAPDLFPRYDRHLELSIVEEAEKFFQTILLEDLSALNFIKSDFVVINERLGRYYGIPNVRGDYFRRVDVPSGVHRGGIVTQASMLSITSNGTRTSPVKRGTWVLKNVLGMDPGLPVANVGEIAPKVPGIDKATVRQRLEIHRELAQCARCHNRIDPLGFALENFNAAGEYREQEGFGYKGRIGRDDPLIDATATMPDGREIVGVAGLQEALLADQDSFLNCLASKMFTYALGRELGFADQPAIRAAVAGMKEKNYSLRSLIYSIVNSELFDR